MNKYLTIKKIVQDSVALYRAHFFYISFLIAVLLIPYGYLVTREELPNGTIIIIPIFLILLMMVEIVCTQLVSTSYVEKDFILKDEFQRSIKKVIQYLFITLFSGLLTFIGLSMFVIPGIVVTIFSNILKVNYIVNNRTLSKTIINNVKFFKRGIIKDVLIIYSLPLLLNFLFALLINVFLDPNIITDPLAFNNEILVLYPYMIAGLIIFFPISICFRCALYYNILKETQLKSSNQLV